MGSHALRDATAVMVALRRIVRLLRLADREAETAHGLTAAQLFVLHSLAESPARSLAELAQRVLTDQSSVSTVIARLVARRLVARRPATTDRRRAELRLTVAGERVARTAPPVPQKLIADVVRGLPTQKRGELVRSLEGLAAAIGATGIAPRMLFEPEPERSRPTPSRRAPRKPR